MTRSIDKRLISVLALLAVAGCSTAAKRPSASGNPASATGGSLPPAEQMGPPESLAGPPPGETYGPPAPQPSETPAAYGPEPIVARPLVLIFGPGLARSFADVGVLRALDEAKIPVGAVVASDVGGLIGSLYAVDGSINHFEWRLEKFKNEIFMGKRALLSGRFEKEDSLNALKETIRRVVGSKDLGDLKIPVFLAEPAGKGKPYDVTGRGEIADTVGKAFEVPGLYGSTSANQAWAGPKAVSESEGRVLHELIAQGKATGVGPLVVIDTLDAKDEGAQDFSEADLVVRPELGGIDYKDYSRKLDAAFQGKAAVVSQLRALKHLVGLPDDDAPTEGVPSP